MDNQIQFQKVGDDSPRTPGKKEGSPLLQAKKKKKEKKYRVPSSAHNLFLF